MRYLHCHTSLGMIIVALSMYVLMFSPMTISFGQVITNIKPTQGPGGLGTTVIQDAPYEISGGSLRGSNLFHSFETFSIGTGDTAIFSNNLHTTATIANILNRVTGGNESLIFGTIDTASAFPQANFWLINPAGIIFGPSAALNVGGSVNISTADYLKMTDGKIFFANPAKTSTLSIEPVAAFGFLGPSTGKISADRSTLRVPDGKTLSLVGGDINIVGGTLVASSGHINLVSVGVPRDPGIGGEVAVSGTDPISALTAKFGSLGNINLSDNTGLVTSGEPGGTVTIRGGQLVIESSVIHSRTEGPGSHPGIGVDVEVTGDIQVTALKRSSIISATSGRVDLTDRVIDNRGELDPTVQTGNAGGVRLVAGNTVQLSGNSDIGSRAHSTHPQAGNAGTIDIQARTLKLDGKATIDTDTAGPGSGGSVEINADTVTLANGAEISVDSTFDPVNGGKAGKAGAVAISTRTLSLDNATLDAKAVGPASGGAVTINAEQATLSNGSQILTMGQPGGTVSIRGDRLAVASSIINSRTQGPESHPGIAIDVAMTGAIELTARSELIVASGPFDKNGKLGDPSKRTGDAGNLRLEANTVSLTNEAMIDSSTFGTGNAGGVTIQAKEAVSLSGAKSIIVAEAKKNATGNAGDIVLKTGQLSVTRGGGIFSLTQGAGNAGEIKITADSVMVSDFGETPITPDHPDGFALAMINSASLPTSGPQGGRAGNITITAPNVTVKTASILSSTSNISPGRAGDISINTQTLNITDGGLISSNTGGSGKGGNITINNTGGNPANTVSLSGSVILPKQTSARTSTISAKSLGSGDAGTININTQNFSLDSKASIETSTAGMGAGGAINANADRVSLTNEALIASSSSFDGSNAGNGGAVTIKATDAFQSLGSRIMTEATNAGGGNITINADQQILIRDSVISSSVQKGPGGAGKISIDPPSVIVERSQILAMADQGRGGDITVAGGVVNVDQASRLDATSAKGIGGSVKMLTKGDTPVDVAAAIQNLNRGLLTIQNVLPAVLLLSDRCAPARERDLSSFVQAGLDAAPAEPGSFLSSPLLSDESSAEMGMGSSHTLLARRLGVEQVALGIRLPIGFPEKCGS